MPTNIKGLQNFARKVASYKRSDDLNEKVAQIIAERGVEIAKDLYGSKKVNVTIQSTNIKGNRKIVAEGKGLAFEEFGTGLVGKGTYDGNLPTEPIEFESPKGKPQRTEGWEYYYPNKDTKVNGGWYAGKVFHRGQIAKAQMFETAKQLKTEIKDLSKDAIKGGNL